MGWVAGTQIGAYEIVGPIGNGGMGEVYKVRHTISQRTEAMKVLLSGAARRPEVTDRFVREIRVLANLNHPNIAALHTAFHHEDQLIMVMEFIEGKNLSEMLSTGMVLRDSVAYIRQAVTALAYAHSQGVIHRDIKPSNIMINSAGQVKLLDFGLALMSTPDPRLTSSGSLLGSVHYISPEQIRGETMDARSDLYAVGVTLFEVITGRLPIQGHSFSEIINGHLQVIPPSPAVLNACIPANLAAITLKALAKNPSERFQNASEFLQALDTVQIESGLHFAVTMETPFVSSAVAAAAASNTPNPSVSQPSQVKGYDPAVINEITSQLANYVGPIAKVIVKRASSSSNNLRELCDKVAREIDSENQRKNFLQSVRKHLGSSDAI
ncbi:serine/threonine protein kinase [Candidatus Koribacter versatilis Ellin345]|uniref:non-specific serine/threonine protein kinase n=1 Tax=Koribacter versatilis (strain Ellin345) TaxID=204669 RepID=Q1IIR5_KORVE|nr:serine/threonine-protein kinase [Candidatus Koribacter versatilis]ABF43235.1 serine/threonine protein kinase [Candidatus Koribacter versatilis Ellin345]